MADEIPFPFPPYSQQKDLMRAIVDCVESSSAGCFESPTGTGKSLSVICATLSWQFKEEKRVLDEQKAACSKKTAALADDWLMAFQTNFASDTAESKRLKKDYDLHNEMIVRIQRTATKTSLHRNDAKRYGRGQIGNDVSGQKINEISQSSALTSEPEDEFSLKHYDSDDEVSTSAKYALRGSFSLDYDDDSDDDNDGVCSLNLPKIFYCSRTHSQISQFVGEIKRTAFSNARCITLGSRRNLCINPDVMSSLSDSKMSEDCLEMNKSRAKKVSTTSESEQLSRKQKTKAVEVKPCAFHSKQRELYFADHALGSIRDIESLTSLGEELNACPYYATRRAVANAQVVCMPYNMMLQDDLRVSMGVRLANSVVVFDEGHNLVEAVNQIFSAETTHDQLELCLHSVEQYSRRFQSILTGKNYYYVNVLMSVIKGFRNHLNASQGKGVQESPVNGDKQLSSNISNTTKKNPSAETAGSDHIPTTIRGSNDFLFQCGLDNVNLFKLRRHIIATNLVRKVGGFADHQAKRANAAAAEALKSTVKINSKGGKTQSTGSHQTSCSSSSSGSGSKGCAGGGGDRGTSSTACADSSSSSAPSGNSISALRSILALITCLTNEDADGRVVVSKASGSNGGKPAISIRFVLLNPSVHFQKIVDQARSVLVLGGTLQPFAYMKSFLFPRVPAGEMRLFSCGHVVHKSSVLAVVAGEGPSGAILEFTHDTRMRPTLLSDLHSALKGIAGVVPNGIVVFFSSYQYMEAVIAKWRTSRILEDICPGRPLFTEPHLAVDAEVVWGKYSKCAVSDGAMLFCVMGGKLSEGINFSDKLCRCVAVIGLPYPDGRDAVLQEKMKFANRIEKCEGAGKRLYEAMCMRTVNQCIGRSIRHINDYAAIVLLDNRYSQPRVTAQLPQWLKDDVVVKSKFSTIVLNLEEFYSQRKT